MKKCTVGKTHKWAFVKNKTFRSQSFHSISFTTKGLYRCECGEVKTGNAAIIDSGEKN